MTDRHLDCKAYEVRALLDGRKTMTRRPAWAGNGPTVIVSGSAARGVSRGRRPSPWQRVQPGDRLWVREAFAEVDGGVIRDGAGGQMDYVEPSVVYLADRVPSSRKWRPAIHMPRWASRLTLIVTATKIERLQDISYVDAHREGVEDMNALGSGAPRWRDYEGTGATAWFFDSRQSFASLWRSLHGPESWDSNHEVVALTFRVVRANIDSAEARAA